MLTSGMHFLCSNSISAASMVATSKIFSEIKQGSEIDYVLKQSLDEAMRVSIEGQETLAEWIPF